jgi:hypothetical protein
MRTYATVVDISLPAASSANLANAVAGGVASASPFATRAGQVAAQLLAPRVQVRHLGRLARRAHELARVALRVAERKREAIAEGDQLLAVELLLLVRGHAPLRRGAHAVALLGLGEDHVGWPACRAACQ